MTGRRSLKAVAPVQIRSGLLKYQQVKDLIAAMAVWSLIICRAECGQDRPSRGGTGPHGSGAPGIQTQERRSRFELRQASPASALSSVIAAFRFGRAVSQPARMVRFCLGAGVLDRAAAGQAK
jgi:hypothetical protein